MKALNRLRRKIFPKKQKKFTNQYPEYQKFNIGHGTYGKPVIHDFHETLNIGKYCSIGPDVTIILGGNHRPDWVTTYPFNQIYRELRHIKGHPTSKGPINIGHDVWIGAGCMILSGVNVGNGACIAAGSVVVKDIPPFAIAGGNPAKVLKYRFDEETIKQLEELKWWEWEEKKIKELVPELMSTDISGFIKKYKS